MTTTTYIPRLKKKYYDDVVPAMMKEFEYKNIMQVPKIEKIVINQGIGEATQDRKLIDAAIQELSLITGQKAVPTFAKRDINNFKLRRGNPIGAKVTLRGDMMYEFLDRLISIAIPRIRDFHGIVIMVLTVGVTSLLVFQNKLFFLKLLLIKLIK